MRYDLVIRGGRIVTAEGERDADLAVEGERIAAVGGGLRGRREIDARGLYVLPGAVDGHVHLDLDLGTVRSADGFGQGSVAAAFGGVTSVVEFVDPAKGEPLTDALERRLAQADGQALIDYGFHMTLLDASPEILAGVPDAYAAGCATFKLYTAYPDYYLNDGELYRALGAVAGAGGMAVVHAENWPVVEEIRRRFAEEGKLEARWHPESRPALAEAEAVHRVLSIARLAGARAMIFHISCIEAADELRRAKERGWDAYGETCPHYLVFPDGIYDRPDMPGTWFICQPPIRGAEQAASLWGAVSGDVLDVISTDHVAFPAEQKRRGEGNFLAAPGGIAGIENRLALMHHFGVGSGRISRSRWVDLCCTRPARLFGFDRKGRLEPGFDADIVLFDPVRPHTITAERLHQGIDYTPYQGMRLTGAPVATVSRGEVIVEDGAAAARPGRGRFVKRRY